MKMLVIGGAGYIGSHFVREAVLDGHDCWVFDNLGRGHRQAVDEKARLIVGDILDRRQLEDALTTVKPDVILHYAAFALVGESVSDPIPYYRNNVAGVINIAAAMAGTRCLVPVIFSSSCAVFGTPAKLPMSEDDPKLPESPYGRSKLMAEVILGDAAQSMGFSVAFLRYFNACGADVSGDLGESHEPETHLIPNAINAALSGKEMTIFGDDFDTNDGTCVRDYIHVTDLATAHLLAAGKLVDGSLNGTHAIHLGTGDGYSNLRIVNEIAEFTGRELKVKFGPRRPGDPAALYTSNQRAKELLGFEPALSSLESIIGTAVEWHRRHPEGFRD